MNCSDEYKIQIKAKNGKRPLGKAADKAFLNLSASFGFLYGVVVPHGQCACLWIEKSGFES